MTTPAPAPESVARAPASSVAPLDLLAALVLDDGRRWGEVATQFQWRDAAAVLGVPDPTETDTRPLGHDDHESPRFFFLTRPRGGSKTTDLAAVMLVALLTQAPPRARALAYASDKDQAAILLDALAGLVARTPELKGALEVRAQSVTVRANGATLSLEAADAAGAFGHRPWAVVVDELAQWPATGTSRRLWEAIVSGMPKMPGSRLAIITSAGDPAHWSHRVLREAVASPGWYVAQTPGPLPWRTSEELAEQARLLSVSAYARLHLNQWSAAEDRLVAPEDLAACVVLDGPQAPQPGRRYVAGLDIGLKNDRTVLAVAHVEHPQPGEPPTVVLDRLHVLEGTRAKPVALADVEAVILEVHHAYSPQVVADPWQAIGSLQRLRSQGVRVREFAFTSQSVGRLAGVLHLLLRDHRLSLPDDPELLDELANVRMRETSPGVVRMDHDPGRHDDRAIALALAALALTERVEQGRSRAIAAGSHPAARRIEARRLLGGQHPGMSLRGLFDRRPSKVAARTLPSRDHDTSPRT